MVEATLILFSIVPIILFIVFGIPVIVGVLVYRDAKKRVDCNPWLWALIAALVPSFIGLIIYAIIRRDYPLKNGDIHVGNYGSQGGPSYDTHYEQHFDENGNPVPPVEQPHRGFPTWAKILLIVGGILIIVGMVAGCGAMISGLFNYTATPEVFYHQF